MLPAVVPVIENDPVRRRPWAVRDALLVRSVASDPLIPLIATVPTSADREDVEAYLDRQHRRLTDGSGYSFAIADLSTDRGTRVGSAQRAHDMGAVAAGGGSARAVRRAVERSLMRAAEAVGFQREGLLRAWQLVGDVGKDMYVYSVLPDR